MQTILLISPYWKEPHRWMVSSVKLAELWQRMGYRVVAICMGKETSTEEVSPTLTIHRVRDLYLKDPLNYGIAPTFCFHVLSVLRKEKPDLIIVNKVLFWSSLVAPLLRLLGKRIIVTTDTLVGMTWHPRGFLPRIIMTIGAWTAGWLVLLSASRVVFFHPQPEKLLRFLGIAKKSEVIPTGIDPSGYELSAMSFEHEKNNSQSSKLKAQSFLTISYIGRLESVKGVPDFLAAVSPLIDHYANIRVQVVGWFKESHPLVAKYQKRVIFTGLRDDIPAILAGTDIFVLPSYSEGLSNALMEAMASGCACIATEVGGNRFLIENGISGLLYPPGDVAMLRRHLERLIADRPKRHDLGKAARKRIEEEFSWRIVEERYRALFA